MIACTVHQDEEGIGIGIGIEVLVFHLDWMKLPTAPLLLPDGEWKINLEYLKVVITLWPLTTITRHIYYILGRLFRITRNPAEAPAPTISPHPPENWSIGGALRPTLGSNKIWWRQYFPSHTYLSTYLSIFLYGKQSKEIIWPGLHIVRCYFNFNICCKCPSFVQVQ